MHVSFSLIPVILTRLLALVNARSAHSLHLCVFVCLCISICISISLCGHMSCKALAWPHWFHALFSHLFTSPLRLTSFLLVLLLLILVYCLQRWFTSVTSNWGGSGRQPGEKWMSRECCVYRSHDGAGFNLRQQVGLGVDSEGLVHCRLYKAEGVC